MKRDLHNISIHNQRVLIRVDFNVPLDQASGIITSAGRLRATLPTLRYLIQNGARVIVCAHLGRPGGKFVKELSLRPVAECLGRLLGQPVHFVDECIGPNVEAAVLKLKPGQIMLLENLRFHPGEERNDVSFAQQLALLADIFVQEGFGVVHRAHASIVPIARLLPAVSGFLLTKELEILDGILEHPSHPLVAILGGSKTSDKLGVVENLAQQLDVVLIGGGMAATFLMAQGFAVGQSLVEPEKIENVKRALDSAVRCGTRVELPIDVIVAEHLSNDAPSQTVLVSDIPAKGYIADIGPQTIRKFCDLLQYAKTVFWNGPMGVFEFSAFSGGTRYVAETLASLTDATTVVGGGSTAEAVEQLELNDRITHISTGGGAFLERLQGKLLPGIEILPDEDHEC